MLRLGLFIMSTNLIKIETSVTQCDRNNLRILFDRWLIQTELLFLTESRQSIKAIKYFVNCCYELRSTLFAEDV